MHPSLAVLLLLRSSDIQEGRGVKPRTSPVESKNLWGRMVEMWAKNVGHGGCIHASVPVRICLHREKLVSISKVQASL